LTIVDTPWVSMALGLLVVAAAQAAQAGKSREEILATINALIPQLNLIFVLDTLEYLRRGGRIGGARAMMGTLLNVKPMLEIREGRVEPLEQPRSRSKALRRLLETLEERADHQPHLHVGVLHAMVPDEAAALAQEIRTRFPQAEIYTGEIGPVIGTHVGPAALGLAFYAD
jgi:DegV family protein with EDD domain